MRSCGILLHISSLPGRGPIGTMGEAARGFVDFLSAAGHSVWQVLPVTPPARGNSPYSAYSVFAGNPFLIDLAELLKEDLLPAGALNELPHWGGGVDFEACAAWYPRLLRRSFERCFARERPAVAAFRAQNAYWLEDYALFMALHEAYGGKSFQEWETPLLLREAKALARAKEELAAETDYWCYVQYLFYRQWHALKQYANSRGVCMMGDMPIYTDSESVDIWAHPEIFQLDARRRPTRVAGVPPDGFSPDGQLWGNPLYNWSELRARGYDWWIQRMRLACSLYDIVRIDHFRGLDKYYAIPADAATAREGVWEQGPRLGFLGAVRAALPSARLVAEDLGYRTESLAKLLEASGLPGMKVLQFAFDPWIESDHLPHRMTQNQVAYIGTHDNDTIHGWAASAPEEQVRFAREYLHISEDEELHWGFIRALYGTVADMAIVQMQDVLGLPAAARMNTPAVPKGNWNWRMAPDVLTPQNAQFLYKIANLYGRAGTQK